MGKDLRFAWRMLRRSPGFTAVAVLVLALGIGANTAIFSLVNALLLAPLPFRQPNQLVAMYETELSPGNFPLSGPDFPDWKAQARLFSDMALVSYSQSANLTGAGEPRRVIKLPVEANFFSLLGVAPALGRMFQAGEDQTAAPKVVVLSYPFWRQSFGGDRSLIGRAITLDGQAVTVIGVAPPKFRLRADPDLWTPLDMRDLGQRGNHSYNALGRMKPGVTVAAAQQEIKAIAARLAKQYPDSNGDTGATVFLLHDRLVQAPQRGELLTLLWVVGLVLLIACANVANLLLARALGRRKEISIRLALGARRGQIVRQLLTESVLLALAGAALGAVLAELAVGWVASAKAFPLPEFNAIQVNGGVLAFTAALAVVCGVLFGLAPAWQLSRPQLNDELAGAGALAGAGRHRRWLSDSLIVAEVAVSLVLIVAAGLFLKSFARLRSAHLGLDPTGLTTAELSLPPSAYSDARLARFQQALLPKLDAIPGVTSASLSSELPLEGGSNGYITLPGHSAVEHSLVEWTRVTPSYFQTLGIPLVAGAGYTQADVDAWQQAFADYQQGDAGVKKLAGLRLSIVVNQAMARHFYPGHDAVGQHFRQGDDGPWLTIKAVAADVPVFGLDDGPMAQAYFPTLSDNGFFLEVRSRLPAAEVTTGLRRAVASLDANLPVFNIRTMDQVADASVAAQAFEKWLIAAFAALALLLAAAGLYGVMAYLVGARTREIGVRMALGASPGRVMGMIVGRGLALAGVGVALGTAAALAAGHLIASQLYHASAGDPAVLASAAAVLLAASALACYVPARRAARVDPNAALRIS